MNQTILSRMFPDEQHLTREAAEYLLKIRFGDEDVRRSTELMERNTEGELDVDERRELDEYARAMLLIARLHSQARRVLKRPPAAAGAAG